MITEDGEDEHPCGNLACLLGYVPNPLRLTPDDPRNIPCAVCRPVPDKPLPPVRPRHAPASHSVAVISANRKVVPPRANDCYYHPRGPEDGCSQCRSQKVGESE